MYEDDLDPAAHVYDYAVYSGIIWGLIDWLPKFTILRI
jgi:hypothetical protein